MPPAGRNHPCPCGSGKKYKMCCLAKDEAPLQEALRVAREARRAQVAAPSSGYQLLPDPIDDLSNRANSLIRRGKLDEAQLVCRQLLQRYPNDIDGHERMSQLLEARGDRKAAADSMRQVLALALSQEGFDPESYDSMRKDIARLET